MHLHIDGGSIYPEPFDVAQGKPFDVAQGKPFGFAQGSALSGVECAEQASFDAAGGLAQDSPERSRGTKRVEGLPFDPSTAAQDRGERAERVEPRLRSG